MTMATGSSPTSTTTDNTSTLQQEHHLPDQPSTNTDTCNNDDNSATSTDSIKVIQVKSGHGIYSSQPRFYIPAIQSRFKHTKNRFCYKIKVSFPWIDSATPPTLQTYHSTIQLFFSLVNKHDKNLEILPWDIRKETKNTINHSNSVPTSHSELTQYVYNLQLTKTRIRFSCVISLSSTFRQMFRQKEGLHNKLSLLQQMQQKSIWVQQVDLQTMGDQKIIGYLQNVHPSMTNQKKLLTDLQSIVETRDISLELFRPRAIDNDGTLLATTEAFAITVPTDISNQMHSSLVDKWDDIKNGVYNDIIGNDSLLINSYFIPFKRGLCTHAVRNKSICLQKEFNRTRTGIYITQCNTIDTNFTLTDNEAKAIGVDHWDLTEPVSLRSLIMSYKQPNTDKSIVETIQNMGFGNFVLVIDKKYSTLTTDSISILLDTLTTRDDYNTICDTKVQTKPSLRIKKLSKKSQKYISCLQETIMCIGDKEHSKSTKTPTKRKHETKKVNHLISNSERVSPDFKKSTQKNIDSDDSGFSSPEKANETGKTLRKPIAIKKLTPSVLLKKHHTLSKQRSSTPTATYVQVAMTSKKKVPPEAQFSTLVRTDTNTKQTTQLSTQVSQSSTRPPTMIPLSQRETTTAISSTSTLTPNTVIAHRNSQFSNDQVLQIKQTMKQQYDNALEMMEIAYSKKFDALTASNQQQLDTIHSKIDSVNETCKNDIERVRQDYLTFQTQFKEQNDMLVTNSAVLNEQKTMLATITEVLTKSNRDTSMTSSYRKLQKRRDKKLKKKEKKRMSKHHTIPLPDYSSPDDLDLSYSDIEPTPPTKCKAISTQNEQSSPLSHHCRTLDTDYSSLHSDHSDSSPRLTPTTKPSLTIPESNCQTHSSSTTVSTFTTETTDLSTLTNENGWTTIPTSDASLNKINHLKCLKSPSKVSKQEYNKNSPTYNRYDPTGQLTQRRSVRLQEQSQTTPTRHNLQPLVSPQIITRSQHKQSNTTQDHSIKANTTRASGPKK
jgi:hypothetical protein